MRFLLKARRHGRLVLDRRRLWRARGGAITVFFSDTRTSHGTHTSAKKKMRGGGTNGEKKKDRQSKTLISHQFGHERQKSACFSPPEIELRLGVDKKILGRQEMHTPVYRKVCEYFVWRGTRTSFINTYISPHITTAMKNTLPQKDPTL